MARKQIIDNATIASKTWNAKKRIESILKQAELFLSDPDKQKRHKQQECKVCFYIAGRVGGSAVTTAECGLCSTEKMFNNTCVDVLCQKCAKKHELCKHCGGDIDCIERRKQRF